MFVFVARARQRHSLIITSSIVLASALIGIAIPMEAVIATAAPCPMIDGLHSTRFSRYRMATIIWRAIQIS